MRRNERERFDKLFEEVLASLPEGVHALIEEVPLVLEDRPSRQLLRELGIESIMVPSMSKISALTIRRPA